jgi:hypothetical protein
MSAWNDDDPGLRVLTLPGLAQGEPGHNRRSPCAGPGGEGSTRRLSRAQTRLSVMLPILLLPPGAETRVPAPASGADAALRDPTALVAALRSRCTPDKDGAFDANAIGQALAALGYETKGKRRRALAAIPGLRRSGAHPNNRIHLPA